MESWSCPQAVEQADQIARIPGRLGAWIDGLPARRPFKVVVAAVADKLAGIVRTMLCRGDAYRIAAWDPGR